MPFRVHDVTIDLARMQIDRAGAPVHVEPQVFDVVRYLLEHRDRVVTKSELLDHVWGDRFVSESALTSRIKSARRALGDNGHDQRVIRTVTGRGFRFVGDVADEPEPGDAGVRPGRPPTTAPGPADARLDEIVAGIAQGRGAAVAIVSDGAGTPAAVQRIAEAARVHEWRTARIAGAAELGPYAGLRAAVARCIRLDPGLVDALPTGPRAEIVALVGDGRPSSRQRLLVAAAELVAAVTERSPGCLLVVADLHLADLGTFDAVRFLASQAHRLPFVLVATHRRGFDLAGGELESLTATGTDGDADGPTDREPSIPAIIRDPMRTAAAIGDTFEQADLRAVVDDVSDEELERALDIAIRSGVLAREDTALRFTGRAVFEALRGEIAPERRRDIHARLADALIARDAPAERVARHLVAAGEPQRAARYALAAAREAAVAQTPGQVVRWTSLALEHLDGPNRSEALALRGQALVEMGDPSAVGHFRDALQTAPDHAVPGIRARLGRALLLAGDVDGAAEVLEGLEPTGARDDAQLLLVRAMLAYFRGDLDAAERLLESARSLALLPGAPARILDVITLQGLIAHNRGRWFDRLRRELAFSRGSPDLARALFDAHVCVAEYVLYGPTPRTEVLDLAEQLADTATRIGSPPALAFARALVGEIRLADGELDAARASLEEALALYRSIGGATGEAHALQRLADVSLATGEPERSEREARGALAVARWSPMSHHLLPRILGTLIAAAADPATAVDRAREAERSADEAFACPFCEVILAVPSAIAYAMAGETVPARRHLERAERSAALWEGEAWHAAVTEARAILARAEGMPDAADHLFREAAAAFERAGQPRDAARCRAATVPRRDERPTPGAA